MNNISLTQMADGFGVLYLTTDINKEIFRTSPGRTAVAHHYIPTAGTPTRVLPRRIPAHFKVEVLRQLQVMLDQGIIEESNSPWMAPTVFVRKKTGDL